MRRTCSSSIRRFQLTPSRSLSSSSRPIRESTVSQPLGGEPHRICPANFSNYRSVSISWTYRLTAPALRSSQRSADTRHSLSSCSRLLSLMSNRDRCVHSQSSAPIDLLLYPMYRPSLRPVFLDRKLTPFWGYSPRPERRKQ